MAVQRTANHFRIYRSAGPRDRENLPSPLAEALCNEATLVDLQKNVGQYLVGGAGASRSLVG